MQQAILLAALDNLTRYLLFAGLLVCTAASLAATGRAEGAEPPASRIKSIELIHCTHTDYGFTDHPMITDDLHIRFLDIALDAILATKNAPEGERFRWTAELLDPVHTWWSQASAERRQQFLEAIRTGQLEVMGLPYHMQRFANARQWQAMLNWVPGNQWDQFNIRAAMQHDVNGFPRVAAVGLLDKGIRYLWTGINVHWGGAPFPQPSAFWWKMPDGRKLLVWQGESYWKGYDLFSDREWRIIQAEAHNLMFRPPRAGDILAADEASVRAAHRCCLRNLERLSKAGYPYRILPISITNQWRIDNDGPFPPLVDFVKMWNAMDLQPVINLTTPAEAMRKLERLHGDTLPVHEGEWPDWWDFGVAATPRELAAARLASQNATAALSPVWGEATPEVLVSVNRIDREICRFFEHTCGANEATQKPYSYFTLGHFTEKQIHAYRPYEQAKFLLAQRARQLFTDLPEGLYVANPGAAPYSGWIELEVAGLRGEAWQSVADDATGKTVPLFVDGKVARFWVHDLPANRHQRFILRKDAIAVTEDKVSFKIAANPQGWPDEVTWNGVSKPLVSKGVGDFASLESTVGRSIGGIWHIANPLERANRIKKSTKIDWAAAAGAATVKNTPYTVSYEQSLVHPRLEWAVRRLELWKDEPRARLHFKLKRKSSANPEIFYVALPLPETGGRPVMSNGGMDFEPYRGQLPGSNTDSFAADGWVHFPSSSGSWVWSSRESAMFAFGSPKLAVKSAAPPAGMHSILAMVYNNMWEVNYLADCPGEMEFTFDLFWNAEAPDSKQIAETVQTYQRPPVVMLNPPTREDPHTHRRMNEIK